MTQQCTHQLADNTALSVAASEAYRSAAPPGALFHPGCKQNTILDTVEDLQGTLATWLTSKLTLK